LTSDKSGSVVLELVKAGHRFHCRLDLANRSLQLAIDGGRRNFDGASGQAGAATATAQSSLPDSESFDVLFANIDSQLLVWIDGELLTFDGPTTYDLPVAQNDHRPADLSPVGIGAKGAKVKVEQLRVARDVYYLNYEREPECYELADMENDAEDQFFMLGDNSAQSSDARAWDDHWVKRDLLIGKALFIYWPHSWDSPVPFTPNWKRMRFIK
jgi:signal peptidase I